MDQNKDLFELDVTSKCNHHNIDLEINKNDVITTNRNEKKKVARRRWAILAKALKVKICLCPHFYCQYYNIISNALSIRVRWEVNHQVQPMNFHFDEFLPSCF